MTNLTKLEIWSLLCSPTSEIQLILTPSSLLLACRPAHSFLVLKLLSSWQPNISLFSSAALQNTDHWLALTRSQYITNLLIYWVKVRSKLANLDINKLIVVAVVAMIWAQSHQYFSRLKMSDAPSYTFTQRMLEMNFVPCSMFATARSISAVLQCRYISTADISQHDKLLCLGQKWTILTMVT